MKIAYKKMAPEQQYVALFYYYSQGIDFKGISGFFK
jgi:hypothetical protein